MKRKVGSTASLTYGEVEAIAGRDRGPVGHPGPAERIDPDVEPRAPDGLEVQDGGEIVDVRVQVVVPVRGRCPERPLVRRAPHVAQSSDDQLVRARADPVRDVGVGRAPVGRIVLEAAVLRRVVRRCDHNAVREAGTPATVMDEDGVRDGRRRREASVPIDHRLHLVGGQNLERGPESRLGHRVGVPADEERALDPLRAAVEADRLADGQDMRLVEALLQR
jgi:hypothetical protein